MLALRSVPGVVFATLFAFAGCTFVSGPYYGPQHASAGRRPPSSKPPGARQPAKPKPPQQHRPAPKPAPKPAPRPQPRPQPKPTPKPDPSGPNGTQMVVPVRVDFAATLARIDAMIPRTHTQDWQTVSASGAAIKVEARYKVWRDPIQAKLENGTLRVTVPVRYAADVRASAKKPFGGTWWLTRGLAWGTQNDPQRLSAKFSARFTVEPDYRVEADARLDDIDHGKAPSGQICVKAAVKLCITREAMAPMVHKKLEAALVPQIEKALGQADKQVEKALNLKKQAQQLWTMMQQPLPLQQLGQANCPSEAGALCSTPAWLTLRPASLGVSQPRMDGKDLRVDLALGGALTVRLGDKPAVKPAALPRLQTTTGKPGFAVTARLRIPAEALSDELAKQLAGQKFGDAAGIGITRVSLGNSTNPRFPNRIEAAVSLRGAVNGDVKLHGDLKWDAKRRRISLTDIDFTVDSDSPPVRRFSAADKERLIQLLESKAHWQIDARAGALRKAITRALGGAWRGHLHVNGELGGLEVERFAVERGDIAADVLLTGQLDIALSP